MSPSEQCCLHLLRGFEEVLGGSDNGHVVCVCVWDLFRCHFYILAFCFAVCILYIVDKYV